MNILSTVDRLVTATALKSAVNKIADHFLPVIDAEAGVIDCYRTRYGTCGDCTINGNKSVTFVDEFAESSQCASGWPVCDGCNWIATEAGCTAC